MKINVCRSLIIPSHAFLLLLLCGCQEKPVFLAAKDEIAVYKSSKEAESGSGEVIFKAKRGDSYLVVSCKDLKSKFILGVQRKNGEKGFVGDGSYDLSGEPVCY